MKAAAGIKYWKRVTGCFFDRLRYSKLQEIMGCEMRQIADIWKPTQCEHNTMKRNIIASLVMSLAILFAVGMALRGVRKNNGILVPTAQAQSGEEPRESSGSDSELVGSEVSRNGHLDLGRHRRRAHNHRARS